MQTVNEGLTLHSPAAEFLTHLHPTQPLNVLFFLQVLTFYTCSLTFCAHASIGHVCILFDRGIKTNYLCLHECVCVFVCVYV